MENDIRDKIERWKIKAEIFLKNDTKAFIIDVTDQYYFCEVIFVGEDCIHVQGFKGKLSGEKSRIYWSDIIKFEEYREEGE